MMKTKNIFKSLILLFVVASTLTACLNGKGEVVIQNFDVTGFTQIDHGIKGDVIIVNDVNQFVEVHAQQNVIDALKIESNGGTLKIRTQGGKSIGKYDELTYYVHMPLLERVVIGGKGTVKGADITGDRFTCKLAADGKLELTGLDVSYTEVIITGAGKVLLKGESDKTDVGLGSAGHAQCFELFSKECNTQLKGNGIIEVMVIDKLDVVLSGSGTIYYKGNPPTITKNINGSGILVRVP
jgi:hypothetical protein